MNVCFAVSLYLIQVTAGLHNGWEAININNISKLYGKCFYSHLLHMNNCLYKVNVIFRSKCSNKQKKNNLLFNCSSRHVLFIYLNWKIRELMASTQSTLNTIFLKSHVLKERGSLKRHTRWSSKTNMAFVWSVFYIAVAYSSRSLWQKYPELLPANCNKCFLYWPQCSHSSRRSGHLFRIPSLFINGWPMVTYFNLVLSLINEKVLKMAS